jgi:hypothetical protein
MASDYALKGLAFRGGDNDMTRVSGASIEGQRKTFEKLGI